MKREKTFIELLPQLKKTIGKLIVTSGMYDDGDDIMSEATVALAEFVNDESNILDATFPARAIAHARRAADAWQRAESRRRSQECELPDSVYGGGDPLYDDEGEEIDAPEGTPSEFGNPEQNIIEAEVVFALDNAIKSRCNEQEQEVLRLRFDEEQTQQQVAEKLGITQQRVQIIERTAVAKLRDAMLAAGFDRTDLPTMSNAIPHRRRRSSSAKNAVGYEGEPE